MSSATYKALPLSFKDPTKEITLIQDPAYKKASPYGWHNATQLYTNTQGNNAKVYSNLQPGHKRYFVDGGQELQFLAHADFTQAPTEVVNRDAAITNLFYGVVCY